ncbi:hypothetical protein D1BOALGB6SA_8262 [Olavius sp. associated proteobacterium Delta 1]|nr:hypothetical protein D1BOALGB6SA_8262 [Olavius sp. associated proteobacterium Delta 1]
MNTGRKPEGEIEEIDEVFPLTGDGDERRFGIERRCYSYTAYVPERRSGCERRTNADTSLPSYQQ